MNWEEAKTKLKDGTGAKLSSALSSITSGSQYLQHVDVVVNDTNVKRLRRITPAEGGNPEMIETFIRHKDKFQDDWTVIS